MPQIVVLSSNADRALAVRIVVGLRAAGLSASRDDDPASFDRRDGTGVTVLVVWTPTALGDPAILQAARPPARANRLVGALSGVAAAPAPFDHAWSASLDGWIGDDAHPGWRALVAFLHAPAAEPMSPAPAPPPDRPAPAPQAAPDDLGLLERIRIEAAATGVAPFPGLPTQPHAPAPPSAMASAPPPPPRSRRTGLLVAGGAGAAAALTVTGLFAVSMIGSSAVAPLNVADVTSTNTAADTSVADTNTTASDGDAAGNEVMAAANAAIASNTAGADNETAANVNQDVTGPPAPANDLAAPAPAAWPGWVRPAIAVVAGLWIAHKIVAVGGVATIFARRWLMGRRATPGAAVSPAPIETEAPALPVSDAVDVSAFAPDRIAPGEKAIVQIYLHNVEDAGVVAERARSADPQTQARGVTTLDLDIARGARVDVLLEADGLAIDQPSQSMVWQGRPGACQFVVAAGAAEGRTVVTASLFVTGVPVGRLAFTVEIAAAEAGEAPALRRLAGEKARRYRRAFLSYSSYDRPEVLKRVDALRAAGIDYFQDILSIEPGEEWRPRLFAEIDSCDLFLLFWSSHAADSAWVLQEAEHALGRRRASDDGVPDITPIILEGPPIPHPPESLSSLHFNDVMRYIVVASEMEHAAKAASASG